MKRVLLLIISIFLAQSVMAYETVLVDFPPTESWYADYYENQGDEAIVQYVPGGQSARNWRQTVVFHSYKNIRWISSASRFMDRMTAQMELRNNTQPYKYLKYTDTDAISTRCIKKNAYTPAQCEIYRASNSYEGLISMHYINKDIQDFKDNYNLWYEIIKGVRIYYSYYRNDRILNKATIFEL